MTPWPTKAAIRSTEVPSVKAASSSSSSKAVVDRDSSSSRPVETHSEDSPSDRRRCRVRFHGLAYHVLIILRIDTPMSLKLHRFLVFFQTQALGSQATIVAGFTIVQTAK